MELMWAFDGMASLWAPRWHGLVNILWVPMIWPHCERLDGMASQISFPPSPQSIFPSTPTYLLPDSSDHRPTFSACPGGGVGGLVLLPFPPCSHPPPMLFPSLPPEWQPCLPLNPESFLWLCPSEFLLLFPPLLYQWPPWDPQYIPPLSFLLFYGSMTSLSTLMYFITESLLCPRTGTCERLQDLIQSPFDRKRRQI